MTFSETLKYGRFWRYAPLILWIGVLLFASTGNASMSNTSRFIRPVLEFLFPLAADETLTIYHGFIRKTAHFAGYATLAFFAVRAFSTSRQIFIERNKYLLAFFLTALIAVIDETNQSFNAARTGSIYDVLLDCTGGSTVILLFIIFRKIFPLLTAKNKIT